MARALVQAFHRRRDASHRRKIPKEGYMLHIVRLIERRHPTAARVLVPVLVALLSAALALGIALLALR
jgi:hypothetical protein